MPGKQSSAEQLQLLWRITGMAFMLSADVAAGALIGWLVDRWRDSSPTWMTIGGLVGLAVGMTGFIRAAFKLNRSQGGPGSRGGPRGGTGGDPGKRRDDADDERDN